MNIFNRLFGLSETDSSADLISKSSKALRLDLLRLHPDAAQLIDVDGLLGQIEAAGLVYDGAMESGVVGLYPADHSWPHHSTIHVDLLNWPREGIISFWPPLAPTDPATVLSMHASKNKQAQLSFLPAELSGALEKATCMTQEAFESNRANATLE